MGLHGLLLFLLHADGNDDQQAEETGEDYQENGPPFEPIWLAGSNETIAGYRED